MAILYADDYRAAGESRVVSKERISRNVLVLGLEPVAKAGSGGYEPGAHIDLVLPNGLVRQYSLLPGGPGKAWWRVAVLREMESRGGSAFIHDELSVGDSIRVVGPRNHFKVVPAQSYLFIAGGIGITPLLGMMQRCEAAGVPWQLAYGGKSRASMAFLSEVENAFPGQVTVYPRDVTGRMDIQSLVDGLDGGGLIYCCGPASMIEAVQKAARNLPTGTVHVEHFAPADIKPSVPDTAFDVQLARSAMTLRIPAGQSILQILDGEDVWIVSSCEEGTCGSCETRVLAGIVDHRDSVLTDDQRAKNDTMMVCVSRAKSPVLVLDI